MADLPDPFRLWRETVAQLYDSASAATGGSELGRQLYAVVQQQAEFFDRVLQQQSELQTELVARTMAPLTAALELFDQTAAAMRSQSEALTAAADSFGRVAELLENQAELTERASAAMRLGLPAVTRREADAAE
jgi:hypothetical protein